jgi:N-acyl-D-amino-acid deacylase
LLDLIISDAKIYDGSSRPYYYGDVGISGSMIRYVGAASGMKAKRRISAAGRVLAPGFIDMHSHSDTTILVNPSADSKIRQGVTTEIIGNCGNSLAPLAGPALEHLDSHLDGYGLSREWTSVREYLNIVCRSRPAVNIAMVAGHGTIRRAVLGNENKTPTPSQMAGMKKLLIEALQDGAYGMSTGLIYPPGFYADTDELVCLATVLQQYAGLFVSHIRGEGPTLIEAVREIIEIGEKTGASVHISHHKATGQPHWGKVKNTLAMIDDARRRWVDISGDVYPYRATNTLLQTFLPRWVHEGGVKVMLEKLQDNDVRYQLVERLRGADTYQIKWENIMLAHTRKGCNGHLEGKNLAEIANIRQVEAAELVIDLICEEEGTASVIIQSMCEEDIEEVLKHHTMMIGSDGSCLTLDGPLGQGNPHPRNYGTFPRVLAEYSRKRGIISLESAINKMSFMSAKRLGLQDRGLIMPGFKADLVLLDYDHVCDMATYEDPKRYPRGIDTVIVNGTAVIDEGEMTGSRSGTVLRRGSEAK